MANIEALKLLQQQDVDAFNKWVKTAPEQG